MATVLRKNILLIWLLSLCLHCFAQTSPEPVFLGTGEAGAYSIIERSDWRRYDNGRYVGLVRNEVRASIIPETVNPQETANPQDKAYPVDTMLPSKTALPSGIVQNDNDSVFYHGNFFVLQSTLRDMRQSAQAVDAIIPVSFELMKIGAIEIENDRGYPMMRGFPSFPGHSVTRGAKWKAPGNRAVDPFNTGQAIVIPFTAEYEYRGTEYYNNILVHRIYAAYGYNYLNEIDPHPYTRVMGNHKVDILLRVEDGLPVFLRDDLSETFTLANGSRTEFRGFTLTFGSGIVPLDRGVVVTSLENILNTEHPVIDTSGFGESSIELTPVPEGIKLTIRDIRFAPDLPEILPEEKPRLDLLAEALKQIPGRTFLVEGHTASTGRPDGEMELSVERAVSIINELVRRGIAADRFIYKGWGGTRPVGDNATDAGRSANRRVEITILE